MKKAHIYLLVACIGVVSAIRGHNPNLIAYELKENDQTLTVHFTLNSVLDLLSDLCPNATQGTSLHISDYHQDIVGYFNSEIDLKINGMPILFELEEAVLDRHDAFIVFSMESKSHWDTIHMKVDSYTEIYNRTKNIVNVRSAKLEKKFLLDKSNRILTIDG